MIALSFVSALGVLVLLAAWTTAAVSLLALPGVRRLPAALRADAAVCAALLPILTAGVLAISVAAPAFGLGADHCTAHGHHAHLCPWHGLPLTAPWLFLGAAAWATGLARAARVVWRVVRAERLASAMAEIGERGAAGVYVIPTDVPLCHAVGALHPRIVVSRRLSETLPADQWMAAVAHEQGHVDRRDPRWSAILAMATGFAPPSALWEDEWRRAAEEAADDVAASRIDGATVARALVAVARLRLGVAPGLAFDGPGLERRVRRLLGAPMPPGRARAGRYVAAMLVFAALAMAGGRAHLHHGAEETWGAATGEGRADG